MADLVEETPTQRIERLFPKAVATGYTLTSCKTARYNCIAYAAGDVTQNWSDIKWDYWPPAVERGDTIGHLVKLFEHLGYHLDGMNAQVEDGFAKVALYAVGDKWQHAAIQLPNGNWSSKAGMFEDFEHDLTGADCDAYGTIVHVMKRARS